MPSSLNIPDLPASVNEGSLLQITITGTPPIANGTGLIWTIVGVDSPAAVAADFVSSQTTGTVYFTNNIAYVYINIAADQLTESIKGSKDKFKIMFKYVGEYHPAAVTSVISINDTSQSPPPSGFVISKNQTILTGTLNSIEYSVNGGSWISMSGSITVPPNATVQYRATYTKTSGSIVYIEMNETFGAYASGSTTSTSTIYTTTSAPVTANGTLSIVLSSTQI